MNEMSWGRNRLSIFVSRPLTTLYPENRQLGRATTRRTLSLRSVQIKQPSMRLPPLATYDYSLQARRGFCALDQADCSSSLEEGIDKDLVLLYSTTLWHPGQAMASDSTLRSKKK